MAAVGLLRGLHGDVAVDRDDAGQHQPIGGAGRRLGNDAAGHRDADRLPRDQRRGNAVIGPGDRGASLRAVVDADVGGIRVGIGRRDRAGFTEVLDLRRRHRRLADQRPGRNRAPAIALHELRALELRAPARAIAQRGHLRLDVRQRAAAALDGVEIVGDEREIAAAADFGERRVDDLLLLHLELRELLLLLLDHGRELDARLALGIERRGARERLHVHLRERAVGGRPVAVGRRAARDLELAVRTLLQDGVVARSPLHAGAVVRELTDHVAIFGSNALRLGDVGIELALRIQQERAVARERPAAALPVRAHVEAEARMLRLRHLAAKLGIALEVLRERLFQHGIRLVDAAVARERLALVAQPLRAALGRIEARRAHVAGLDAVLHAPVALQQVGIQRVEKRLHLAVGEVCGGPLLDQARAELREVLHESRAVEVLLRLAEQHLQVLLVRRARGRAVDQRFRDAEERVLRRLLGGKPTGRRRGARHTDAEQRLLQVDRVLRAAVEKFVRAAVDCAQHGARADIGDRVVAVRPARRLRHRVGRIRDRW